MDDLPKPPEKPTIKMDIVPDWAIKLTDTLRELGREVRADISLVSNDLGVLKQRVSIMEGLRSSDEARLQNNSIRAKQASVVDLAHEAQLAQERMSREALAVKVEALDGKQDAQLALLQQLVKLTEKPVVKLVFTAIGTAILGYLSARGLK